MKYQVPVGLTAISCGGEVLTPDENGGFDAAEDLAVELAAHGCVPAVEQREKAGELRSRARTRAEKAN